MAKKYKCGKCGRKGHNSATCSARKRTKKKAKVRRSKKKTGKRKCGKCGRVGHNKATCSSKKRKTVKKKKGKKRKYTSRSTGSRALIGAGKGWKVFHYSGITDAGNASNKTWAIKITGNKVYTHWGKTWGKKRSTPKTFGSRQAALEFHRKKLAEKRRKGYVLVGSNRRRRRSSRRRLSRYCRR